MEVLFEQVVRYGCAMVGIHDARVSLVLKSIEDQKDCDILTAIRAIWFDEFDLSLLNTPEVNAWVLSNLVLRGDSNHTSQGGAYLANLKPTSLDVIGITEEAQSVVCQFDQEQINLIGMQQEMLLKLSIDDHAIRIARSYQN